MFSNSSQSVRPEIGKDISDSQDQELLSVLEELQISGCNLPLEISVLTVFNLSNRVLTDIEIKNLDKGLDFAPI